MNKPVGQALQILILGAMLLVLAAGWFYWMTIEFESQNGVPGRNKRYSSLVVVVCLAGAVGGVANNFRRLQKLPLHDWAQTDSQTRWLMTLQIYQSPLIGALFAFVLYGVFASGILQGTLFPEFDGEDRFEDLVQFARNTIPATNADAGKALFWSFVAGFAERFVPNFIDKVAKEAEQAPTSSQASQK